MTILGKSDRIRAIHFVSDTLIHKATDAHTNVFKITGIVIVSAAVPGMIYISNVIPNEAIISPPRIAVIVLNNPIFLPFFSASDNLLRRL
jgi:hypothetical protein